MRVPVHTAGKGLLQQHGYLDSSFNPTRQSALVWIYMKETLDLT